MTGNPCNCGTCNKRATDMCPLSTVANNIGRHGDYERIISVFRLVGCLSHPDARKTLMAPVIEELEKYIEHDDITGEFVSLACWDKAISLIRDGVKK